MYSFLVVRSWLQGREVSAYRPRCHRGPIRHMPVGYGQVTSISKGLLTGPAIGLVMSAPLAVPVIL